MAFSIVIPSRSSSNLVRCVRAIREAGETARIIVVDDGLRWDTFVNRDVGLIEIVRGEKPFVFARNVNIGIRATGQEDVILLNDDALLKSERGFTLLSQVVRESRVGVAAAACNNVGNQNQWKRRGKERREEPRMVCFVCVYIPRATINTVGLLDERFIGYGLDDDDYCLRVRNAGLKLGIFDGCYVDHSSLKSSFRGEAGAGGDFSGNMKLFIEKWGFDNREQPIERSPYAALFPAVKA